MNKDPRRMATVEEATVNLREYSRMGSEDLVQKLLNEGADPFEGDDDGKTALHYAAECEDEDVARRIIQRLLLLEKRASTKWEKASEGDKYGRNVLHFAAFLGRKELCRWLLELDRDLINTEDRDGQSAIFYAVAGPHDDPEVVDLFSSREKGGSQVFVKDFIQTTLLHVAAARGNQKMVEKLLSEIPEKEERRIYVEAPNVHGQTALHKAASGGHKAIVKTLLENGADPFGERDYDGRTALQFAAKAEGEHAVEIAKLCLECGRSDGQRSVLLSASVDGIGLRSNPKLEEYVCHRISEIKKAPAQENSLRVAAKLGDIDTVLELISRGESKSLIDDWGWMKTLSTEEQCNVNNVRGRADLFYGVEVEADKPALQDTLGRIPFAIGLAALFSNPLVQSPINVGILGEWGMGKSSVMLQTEIILLKTAARLAFTNPYQENDISGVRKSKLSKIGKAKRREIENGLETLPIEGSWARRSILHKILFSICRIMIPIVESKVFQDRYKELRFNFVLESPYHPRYHQILKSIAVMDKRDMFDGEGNLLERKTPSILTIKYNAWHYRNETQAWAGLAVEITKELEAVMTVAHKLRTSWMYNWTNRRNSICLKVIFPFLLALVVSIFLSILVWLVLGTAHNKDIKKLKYGGLPTSIIVAVWGLGKSVVSFVKPISSQIESYICLPDHSQNLGYHNKVISDIKFLIKELSYKRSKKWEVFAFIWCCITFNWDKNYVPETKIPKMPPACGDNLRIIVFVDDLDRCEENVILQILSAVHLVVATCEINVIMSMEKNIIRRVIIKKYGNANNLDYKFNEELANKYLRKIVQLPLHLADPSDKDSSDFLERQLGMWDIRQGPTDAVAETEKHIRKVNLKFQIGTSIPEKRQLDMTQQGSDLEQVEQQETTNEPEGSGVEEAKIEIDKTVDSEQAIEMDEQGDQQQGEITEGRNRSRMDNLYFKIMSKVLSAKYSPGERSAIRFFYSQSKRSKKLPREWKCLMAYHRLAYYILSLSPDVDSVDGWRGQLIAWIFVCWEWSDLIATLIQKWNKLEVLRNWKAEEGPSLREIVEYYIDERWPAEKKRGTKKEYDTTDTLNNLPGKKEDDKGGDDDLKQILKEMREDLTKVQEEMRDMMKLMEKVFLVEEDKKGESSSQQDTMVKENQSIIIKKYFIGEDEEERESSEQRYMTDDEEREEWNKLKQTLRSFNVSMDGIQAFKRFMFNCEPGYLPWPLPK